jgi:RNA polymerase sigma-70 factor, ECF subfamily
MSNSTAATEALLNRLRAGSDGALAELFAMYQAALRRMIELRLDPRLKGRVSPSDVVQDTYIEAAKRLPHFLNKPQMSFFVWLRLIAGQRLIDVHRRQFGAQKRSVGREISLHGRGWPAASSMCLAGNLVDRNSSPSHAAQQTEILAKVAEVLETLDPVDREVLSLRHFEELSNAETAELLGIESAAASKRYIRALERLRSTLLELHGSLE